MKRFTTLITVLLLATIIASTTNLANCQSPTITDAQTATTNAYNAITTAYKAGADTNQLIEHLNQAVNLTQQAQQLSTSNPQQAETLANQAIAIAQNVTQQAASAQQNAANTLPIFAVATAAAFVVSGVAIYFLGPKLYWKIWFRLRRNYRLNSRKNNGESKALIITPKQICSVALAVTVILAFISVSGLLIPNSQGEQFSELGILGPNMKLADYPSKIVATETIHLYGYVGNQMGEPMYYAVLVKLGDNNTAVNPSSVSPIQEYRQVVGSNQSWVFPVDLTLTKVGNNQRVIFELWIYNQTINENQYHQRWGQIWLNVTSPAT